MICDTSEWSFPLLERFDREIGRIAHEKFGLDTYANQMEVPPHLCSLEFFEQVEARLAKGGWLTINLGGFGLDDRPGARRPSIRTSPQRIRPPRRSSSSSSADTARPWPTGRRAPWRRSICSTSTTASSRT